MSACSVCHEPNYMPGAAHPCCERWIAMGYERCGGCMATFDAKHRVVWKSHSKLAQRMPKKVT